MSRPDLSEVAEAIVDRALGRSPTLGTGRLICVEGPSGAGKTTLAQALRRGVRDRLRGPRRKADCRHVALLHMDNLYPGWDGLAEGMQILARDVLGPLREGRPGRFRRYDWVAGELAEERMVQPVDVLVVEGVGSGASAVADAVTCLVWVETPQALRTRRGVDRDGEQMREPLARWQQQEAEMFTRERPWERADAVVDGTDAALPPRFR